MAKGLLILLSAIHLFDISEAATHLNENPCLVNSFQPFFPGNNFDINKFAGKWFEQIFWAGLPIDVNNVFVDGAFVFTPLNNGSLIGMTTGRLPTSDECLSSNFLWNSTEIPGVFEWMFPAGGDDIRDVDVIIDTDYVNYAIIYTCLSFNTDGTCNETRINILSRCEAQNKARREFTLRKAKQLCPLPPSFDTEQTGGCPLSAQTQCPVQRKDRRKNKYVY